MPHEKGSVFTLVVNLRAGIDLVTVLEAILTSRQPLEKRVQTSGKLKDRDFKS